MRRKQKLMTGEIYHVYSKSITGFRIFSCDNDYLRMKQLSRYFQIENMCFKFSDFIRLKEVQTLGFLKYLSSLAQNKEKIVKIISYCFMPTHIHFILKQTKENGISTFMGNALNAYSRYFNTVFERKGPLWEGKFKNVLIRTNEQLLHLTRYLHLNPVTAYLVNKPENWMASSYLEYLSPWVEDGKISEYEEILKIHIPTYRGFVEDRISYQREVQWIKDLLLE